VISNPRPGMLVLVWYRLEARICSPLHGKLGRVVVAGRGKPRNHGVKIGRHVYVIPAGNLQEVACG
jgi:hypothetical protein